jgi:hypothetical protein
MTPQRELGVDLIRQYTFKGKDNTSINAVCLTVIDPATSWFDIMKLLAVTKIDCPQYGQG